MAKRGRPSSYKSEFPELARKFCMLGATNDDLATMFGVSISTIDNWIAEKPEFLGAVKEGREIADATVAEKLFHRATGYSHEAVKIFNDRESGVTEVPYIEHYPPDTAAAIFWLKNRRRQDWRDKVEVEATHRHDPDSYSDEELAEIVAGRGGRRAAAPKGGAK
jgi:hypothetical protein